MSVLQQARHSAAKKQRIEEAHMNPISQAGRRWLMTLCAVTSLVSAADVVAAPKRAPAITTQPQDLVAITGDAALFSVTATGTTPLYYQWRKNGSPIAGATGTSYVLATATTNDAAGYDVVVNNAYGVVTSSAATLTVHVPPWFTVQPGNLMVATGSDAVFTADAVGVPPPTLQWFFGTNALAGEVSPTLLLTSVRPGHAGDYYCVAANAAGTATSTIATLTVDPTLTITSQPQSRTNYLGTKATFTATASGIAPLSYQWQLNGFSLLNSSRISGTLSKTLVIADVQPGDAGSYTLIVSNVQGMVTSAVATLHTELPPPCVPAVAGLVGWWPGDGNANDIAGTNNGMLQGGATADAPAVVGTGFSLDGTNMYVEIPDAPELKPAELTVECWVKWDNLSTPGTSVYPGQQYIVFKQNSRHGDFEGYVLSKDRTWNDIILWEVSSASGQLVRIDSTSPVTTNVWYHLAGVRGSNYIQIYFNGVLEAQTNVNFPQDYGNWPLYFGTSGQSYWDRRLDGVIDEVALYNRALSADEIAGLYAAGSLGKCRTPSVLVQPPTQVCYWGGSATFTSAISGLAPMSYQWQKDGLAVAGATASSLTLTNLQLANAGSYTVWVTNVSGNATSPPAILDVKVAEVAIALSAAGPQHVASLTIGGLSNQTYGIQAVGNLRVTNSWSGLTNLTLKGPTNVWYDPAPATLPGRFYRVVPGPVPIP
jgi:hypothetical protein